MQIVMHLMASSSNGFFRANRVELRDLRDLLEIQSSKEKNANKLELLKVETTVLR